MSDRIKRLIDRLETEHTLTKPEWIEVFDGFDDSDRE